ASANRSLRHQRCPDLARSLRRFAHGTAAARRRSGGKNHDQDGAGPGVLCVSTDVLCHHWARHHRTGSGGAAATGALMMPGGQLIILLVIVAVAAAAYGIRQTTLKDGD